MRMYIVHTRALPGAAKTTNEPLSIVEVEVEKVTPLQDPSVMWLLPGEFKASILKPKFLHETHEILKEGVKEKVTTPPVYYSHSLYETKEAAREAASKIITRGFEFEIKKGRKTSFTDEEVRARVSEIEEHLLP